MTLVLIYPIGYNKKGRGNFFIELFSLLFFVLLHSTSINWCILLLNYCPPCSSLPDSFLFFIISKSLTFYFHWLFECQALWLINIHWWGAFNERIGMKFSIDLSGISFSGCYIQRTSPRPGFFMVFWGRRWPLESGSQLFLRILEINRWRWGKVLFVSPCQVQSNFLTHSNPENKMWGKQLNITVTGQILLSYSAALSLKQLHVHTRIYTLIHTTRWLKPSQKNWFQGWWIWIRVKDLGR